MQVTREVHTLDRWRGRLTGAQPVIECCDIRLQGPDHEAVSFRGPGRVELSDARGIRFHLYGVAPDGAAAFRKYVAASSKPYDANEQLRFFATDYNGHEWAGGFTSVRPFTDHDRDWPLTGMLGGISTQATGPWVSTSCSVELLLTPPPSLPMGEAMVSSTRIGDDTVLASRRPGRQVVDALGTRVTFANDASDDVLWITADTSEAMAHPYAERWLCEPLRILLGAPIHPRLIARNFGDGTAAVTLLPRSGDPRPSVFGLMHSLGLPDSHGPWFWKLYSDLLTMIGAPARDVTEAMDGHRVTRVYEELSQAARGSRWVVLLTLASTVEALVRSLMTPEDRIGEFPPDALASMERHIQVWRVDLDLRGRMLGALGGMRERSPFAFLRKLAMDGVIPDHVDTWRKLRNAVMHGNLVEPWATEEGDGHVRELTALVHALTRALAATAKGDAKNAPNATAE